MIRLLFFSQSSKYTLGLPQGFRELNCPVFVLRDLSRSSIKEAIDHFRPDLMITTGWAYRRHKREHVDELVKRAAKYKENMSIEQLKIQDGPKSVPSSVLKSINLMQL